MLVPMSSTDTNKYDVETENCLTLLNKVNVDVLLLEGFCKCNKEHKVCERLYERIEQAKLVFKKRKNRRI